MKKESQIRSVIKSLTWRCVARLDALVSSLSDTSKEKKDFRTIMYQNSGKVNLISIGSSLKLCLVAEGVAMCYPRFAPTMEWDTAADMR